MVFAFDTGIVIVVCFQKILRKGKISIVLIDVIHAPVSSGKLANSWFFTV
jgi:hypothetical protein